MGQWFSAAILALCLMPGLAEAQRLIEFYRQALETNPSVRSRLYGIDQARAQEEQATSRLLPQVAATGNYYWNDYREAGFERRYDGTRAGLQARQALLDLASYFKLQGARASVAQSEQQHAAARMALAGEVVDRYLSVLQAEDEISQLQAEKQATEARLKQLRFMRERELVKVTDLYEVEAYLQGLLTREIEARNARGVALERLRETTGIAATSVPRLARDSFPAVPGEEAQWVSDAASSNPNLVALQHAIEAARKLIDSARSEHVPQVSITGSKVHSDQGYDNRLVPSYTVGTIGLQLTIPIYEGGRVQGAVREATARFEIAREQHESARREIERDARTAYLSAVASHARMNSTNEEVRALEKVLEAQTKSYGLGVSTIVDMLIAQRRLYRSRSEQSKARYDYIRDLTTLRVRSGRLTDHDIEEIDGWMRTGNRPS